MNKEELMTLLMPQGTSHCSCLEHCFLFYMHHRGAGQMTKGAKIAWRYMSRVQSSSECASLWLRNGACEQRFGFTQVRKSFLKSRRHFSRRSFRKIHCWLWLLDKREIDRLFSEPSRCFRIGHAQLCGFLEILKKDRTCCFCFLPRRSISYFFGASHEAFQFRGPRII